jgi:Na+-transporting methylmalonyl-CoA/oxaloacetate decarboxylase gamma subunit
MGVGWRLWWIGVGVVFLVLGIAYVVFYGVGAPTTLGPSL